MKKLRLKALSLGATEILSREQLRSITGGCNTDDDCTAPEYCSSGSCWSGASGVNDGSGSPNGGCHQTLGECPTPEYVMCICPPGTTPGCLLPSQCH